jgi:hypothetical protein
MTVNDLKQYLEDKDIKGDEEVIISKPNEEFRNLQSIKLVKNLKGNKVRTLHLT